MAKVPFTGKFCQDLMDPNGSLPRGFSSDPGPFTRPTTFAPRRGGYTFERCCKEDVEGCHLAAAWWLGGPWLSLELPGVSAWVSHGCHGSHPVQNCEQTRCVAVGMGATPGFGQLLVVLICNSLITLEIVPRQITPRRITI